MLISVIIPLYNKQKHIEKAIKSVLNQTYKNFELIVVDDGSTDNGLHIVETICNPKIIIVKQKNSGVSVARNNGVRQANGEVVSFLDADDEYKSNFLECIYNLYCKYPKCGMYATNYEIKENGNRIVLNYPGIDTDFSEGIIEDYFYSSIPYTPVWTSAVAIPKNIFKEVGGFPEYVKNGEDLDLWCRIALKYKIAYSNTVCSIYHRDSENMASKNTVNLQLFPFINDIPILVNDDKIPQNIKESLEKYHDYKKLHAVSTQLFNNKSKDRINEILNGIYLSKEFKTKKLIFMIINFMPIKVINYLYNIKIKLVNR